MNRTNKAKRSPQPIDLHAKVRLAFEEGGVLSGLIGKRYRASREQMEYALRVTDILVDAYREIPDGGDEGGSKTTRDLRASIGCLEGEPGTGKSQGYLVPMLLHSVLFGERNAISTYTLDLMDQLGGRQAINAGRSPDYDAGDRSDMAIAIKATEILTGHRPTVALRKGRQAYVSPMMVESLANDGADEDWSRRDKMKFKALCAWADLVRREDPGTCGLLQEFCDSHELPTKLTASQIVLQYSDDTSNPFHLKHVEASKTADIVLVTHVMSLVNAMHDHSLLEIDGGRPLFALMSDEADRLRDAAELVDGETIRFNRIRVFAENTLKEIRGDAPPAVAESLIPKLEHLMECAHRAATWADELYVEDREFVPAFPDENADSVGLDKTMEMTAHAQDLANALNAITGTVGSLKGSIRAGLRQSLHTALEMEDQINRWEAIAKMGPTDLEDAAEERNQQKKQKKGKGKGLIVTWKAGQIAGLSWTPQRKWAGFQRLSLHPARMLRSLWHHNPENNIQPYLRVAMFTSATLASPGKDPASQDAFRDFEYLLGIFPGKDRVLPGSRFSPGHFGTAVRFVLADPLSPRPVNRPQDQDDLEHIEESDPEGHRESRTNDKWLDYVACMMQRMVEEQTATPALVLTSSFDDTCALSSKLEGDSRFWFHEKGENFHTGAAALADGRVKVLVSPSGWEGRNLRSNDGKTQLVKGIMVTRLPFIPPSPARHSAMLRFYRAIDENKRRKKEPTIGEAAIQKKVEGILRQENLNRALRKFRQGMGRAPRNFHDHVEYWIADHRFPLPEHWYSDDAFLQERREKAREEHARQNADGSSGAGFKPHGSFRRAVSARFQDVLEDATISRVFIAEGLPDGPGLYVPDVLDIVV